MTRIGTALAAVALATLVAACGRAPVRGEGTLRSEGDVVVVRAGGATLVASRSLRLHPGDTVSVRTGQARVAVAGGGRLDLRSGSTVRFSGGASLQRGDLLVQSSGPALKVDAGIGEVSVDGVARLRRGLSAGIGVYRGQATFRAGRTVVVPRLRQVDVPSVGVAPDPAPLRLDGNDAWDRQFLGTALDLTSQLDGQSRYVTANSGGSAPASAVYYRQSVPALANTPGFDDALLHEVVADGAAPVAGDALVAASIALSAPPPFAARWRAIFGLRDLGAQWGIVVLDQQADPGAVLNLVGAALNRSSSVTGATQLADAPPGLLSAPPGRIPEVVAAPAPATIPAPAKPSIVTTTTKPRPAPSSTTTTTLVPVIPAPAPVPSAPSSSPSSPPSSPDPTSALAPVVDPVVGIIRSLSNTGL